MNALERWSLHASSLATGATGLAYGWLRYYGQVQGEFGPEPHHFQALLQHAHVLSAPLQVFALGMVLRGHFLPKLRLGQPEGRATGWILGLVLAPMVLAGYGVQVATEPALRSVLAWVHGLSSLLYLGAYLVHLARAQAGPKPRPDIELPLGTA